MSHKISLSGIIILLTILTSNSSWAQSNKIEIELDPLAYSLGGGSGHIAYTVKNYRLQIGIGLLELPENFTKNKEVTEMFISFPSLKWDIFFGKEDASHGFFAGPTLDLQKWEYKTETDELMEYALNFGMRGGYKFSLFTNKPILSGLYVTPWLGLSYTFNSDNVVLDNIQYDLNPVGVFPTLHLGWSF